LDDEAGYDYFYYDVTNADNLAIVGAVAVDLLFTFSPNYASDITNTNDLVEMCGNSDYLLGDNIPSVIYGEEGDGFTCMRH